MMSISSSRATQMRQDTWRRRRDRRDAGSDNAMTIIRPPAQLADMLVSISRGNIGPEAARDIVAVAKGGTSVEIVFDPETGNVESWFLRTGGERTDAAAIADPATLAPAA